MVDQKDTPQALEGINKLRQQLTEYMGHDAETLISRYPSTDDIIDRLIDINTDIETYEFLAELFFNFLLNEAEHNSLFREQLNFYQTVRYHTMQLYELARAAKLHRLNHDSQ